MTLSVVVAAALVGLALVFLPCRHPHKHLVRDRANADGSVVYRCARCWRIRPVVDRADPELIAIAERTTTRVAEIRASMAEPKLRHGRVVRFPKTERVA